MNKKIILIIEVIIVLILLLIVIFLFLPKENIVAPVVKTDPGIEIFSPKGNEVMVSGLKITGQVNGNGWAGFEGQVGIVKLFDNTGKELGMGILTATEDWMQLPTHFEADIYFDYPGDGTGQLVFYNENASGEPERNKTFVLPVRLAKSSSQTTVVKAYFNNSKDTDSCDKVFYVQRTMPKTEAVAMAALTQLLLGPGDLEKNAGFFTNINPGVKVLSLAIKDGIAKVDFNEQLQKGVAGSCKVTAIRAQITETLKQFSTVKDVVISINGKTEGILQP